MNVNILQSELERIKKTNAFQRLLLRTINSNLEQSKLPAALWKTSRTNQD